MTAVPSPADASGEPDGRHAPRLTIGEVLTVLREDFPDVTISKIRYLESEDLVHPQRTPSGYRKFSSADVARLRYVLAAQRDQYLPLRVIKEHLEALDRGEPLPGGTPPAARANCSLVIGGPAVSSPGSAGAGGTATGPAVAAGSGSPRSSASRCSLMTFSGRYWSRCAAST